MPELAAVVSLSVYSLMNDDQFKEAQKLYAWGDGESKSSGTWFENQFSNCALILEQKGGTVSIRVKNLMAVQDESLPPGERQISSLVDARSYAVYLMQKYSDFNVFEGSNDLDEIFGS